MSVARSYQIINIMCVLLILLNKLMHIPFIQWHSLFTSSTDPFINLNFEYEQKMQQPNNQIQPWTVLWTKKIPETYSIKHYCKGLFLFDQVFFINFQLTASQYSIILNFQNIQGDKLRLLTSHHWITFLSNPESKNWKMVME